MLVTAHHSMLMNAAKLRHGVVTIASASQASYRERSGQLARHVCSSVSCFFFTCCSAAASRAGHLAKYSVMYRLG